MVVTPQPTLPGAVAPSAALATPPSPSPTASFAEVLETQAGDVAVQPIVAPETDISDGEDPDQMTEEEPDASSGASDTSDDPQDKTGEAARTKNGEQERAAPDQRSDIAALATQSTGRNPLVPEAAKAQSRGDSALPQPPNRPIDGVPGRAGRPGLPAQAGAGQGVPSERPAASGSTAFDNAAGAKAGIPAKAPAVTLPLATRQGGPRTAVATAAAKAEGASPPPSASAEIARPLAPVLKGETGRELQAITTSAPGLTDRGNTASIAPPALPQVDIRFGTQRDAPMAPAKEAAPDGQAATSGPVSAQPASPGVVASPPVFASIRDVSPSLGVEGERFGVDGLASLSGPSETRAATLSQTTTPTPHVARQIAQQIGAAVVQTAPGTTEITLNPEELGRIRLTVGTAETGPVVFVQAERADVLDLMRRHIDLLGAEMAHLGLGTASFTFGDQAAKEGEGQGAAASHPGAEDDPGAIPSPRSTIATSGLDLRL